MTNIFDYIDSFLDGAYIKFIPFAWMVFPVLSLMDHKPKKKKNKTMSFEKKIGEEFSWKGHKLKVIESEGCKECFFFNMEDCYDVIFATGACINRKDKKTVCFVESKEGKENE